MSSPIKIAQRRPVAVRASTVYVPSTRRALFLKVGGTVAHQAHATLKNQARNIQQAAFFQLMKRLAECPKRRLGRRLTKNQVNAIMTGVTGTLLAMKQSPRNEDVNKALTQWLDRVC